MTEQVFMRPPREQWVCDFCSSPDVHWRYPARDFPIQSLKIPGPQHGSEGGWAACNVCHALIERGLRDKLAKRSAVKFSRKFGVPAKLIVNDLRKLHDEFWTNREGTATPVT